MAPSNGILICLVCSLLISATVGISFRNQPGVVTAYAGGTAYMKCDLYLDPNVPGSSVSVTWIKSDSRNAFKYISIRGIIVQAYADPTRYSISGDASRGEHDLMITNLKYEDAGMFWCQVTASGQLLESGTGRLTVQVPVPVPTCSMSPLTPRVGQRVTLTCEQEMHPDVDYEALNWWNETSRTEIHTQGRYSDGSIYFTRILTESDRNQRFVCSQGSSYLEGQRNCTVTPLKPIEISTIANQAYTISINPDIKYVTEGSSATFGCTTNAGEVTRWIYGYGGQAMKIRDTRGRYLVNADRTELTVIRTTIDDNNTGVRCVVLTPEGGKLIAHSLLTVLEASTLATNPRIPLPPPPLSTPQPESEEPTGRANTRPSTGHKDTSTLNDPSTHHVVKTDSQSLPNAPEVMTSVDIPTTDKTFATELTTKESEATTKHDVQIQANPGADTNHAGTVANANLNHHESPKTETGGSFKALNPHQVANTKTHGQDESNSGVVGAVMGTLLIIALVVLVVFLVKTKRYPKEIPAWVPPQVTHAIATLKAKGLTKKKPKESANENVNNCEKPVSTSTSTNKSSMRMKQMQIEVVVNAPPPEWQFRLKDVELNKRASLFGGKRRSQMPEGPVYANITPELSKSHIDINDFEYDDEDSDSLFSSDFDDDLDLEGEIAAEMAARSNETNEANETLEDKKSKNVEGLVYAQLDHGPNAEKRSTVFIEGEKTEYAHIVRHGFTAREV